MRKLLPLLATITVAVGCVTTGTVPEEREGREKPRGSQLFYRLVGSQSNAPVLPKTRSAWTQDRRAEVGNTGMADEGYTEYPFCYGLMDFTFVEKHAIYPRLVSGAQADEDIVNTADMVIDHVYEPDGCVWGLTGREFVQTFTATRPELVSVTLLVASEPGTFRAALVEGGPGGQQVGPARIFTSGHSTESGTARWTAGQGPLVPGRTYGIRMWRDDGQKWMPYLHSTGDAYDGGILYMDGTPRPESDMALWIVQEPTDLRRALIEDADNQGWVYNRDGVTFIPRTPSVRLIWLNVSPVLMVPPTEHNCCDLVIRVFSADGKLLAGPKRGLTCGPANGEHAAPFLFAADELLVTPGKRYRIEAYTVVHKAELPQDRDIVIVPRDMQARVYGEPDPGALPAIFNLAVSFPQDSKLKLTFSQTSPSPTRIAIRGDGMKGVIPGVKLKHVDLAPGTTEAVIPVWPGHTYQFELITTGPTGLTWTTPTYQVRMPRRREVEAISQSPPPYPRQFVNLAPPRIASGADPSPLRYKRAVELVNPDFEEGLTGWKASPEGVLDAPDVGWTAKSQAKKHGINTRWGDRIAGFTHVAGEKRNQVFAKSTLSQQVATTPGHVYLLAAMVYTSVTNGPRGDTRVRLFADAAGGEEPDDLNSSQWYWTDGRWLRFQHRWIATADRSTIGFGFFRWRDLDAAHAYVDEVHVYDLGPAPAHPGDPTIHTSGKPSLVLVDPKVEAGDKVEACLYAPPGYVITGLGSRAHYDNITTMWMRIQPLLPDGTLGEPEELRSGWEPDSHLEGRVELPDGYVATGFGAGIAPEWDVRRFGLWGRPLLEDGSLGEEKLFRGGGDRESGFEKQVRIEKGRVLTSAGLNCMFNDVNGIKATSAALIQTAEGKARLDAR